VRGGHFEIFFNLKVSKKNVFLLVYKESLNMLAFRGKKTATVGALCTNCFNSYDEKPRSTEVRIIRLSSSNNNNNNTMASKTIVTEV
jgi:hypothetical protein